jgi:hypothetical protein
MFTKKDSEIVEKSSEVESATKKAQYGVEEAIFKMLKKEGLISESEYAKCIQAFHNS